MNEKNETKDTTTYRFVLNINGNLMYYTGVVLYENSDFYTIDEVKLGNIQIFKRNLVIRRVLENE